MVNKNKEIDFFRIDVERILKDTHINLPSGNKNIMQKDTRPFYVSIKLDSKYSAFIPIRTNLTHNFGFITKTIPKRHMKSGLDFTKSLIVKTEKIRDYLIQPESINYREEKVLLDNRLKIKQDYKTFVFTKFISILNKRPNDRTLKEKQLHDFSSLQYFTQPLKEIQKHRENKQSKSLKNEHSNRVNNTQSTQIKRPILEQIQQAEQKSVQKNQNKPSNRTKQRRNLEK